MWAAARSSGAPPSRALGYRRFSSSTSSSSATQAFRPATAARRRQSDTAVLLQPTARASCRRLLSPATRCNLSTSLIFLTLSLSCATPSLPLQKGRRVAMLLEKAGNQRRKVRATECAGSICARRRVEEWWSPAPQVGVNSVPRVALSPVMVPDGCRLAESRGVAAPARKSRGLLERLACRCGSISY